MKYEHIFSLVASVSHIKVKHQIINHTYTSSRQKTTAFLAKNSNQPNTGQHKQENHLEYSVTHLKDTSSDVHEKSAPLTPEGAFQLCHHHAQNISSYM